MATKVWLKWDKNNLVWDKTNVNWDEVFILIEAADALGGGGTGILVDRDHPWQTVDQELEKKGWDKEKRKRLLKLIVTVNNLDYEQSRELDDLEKEVRVEHIKNTMAQALPNVRVVATPTKRDERP